MRRFKNKAYTQVYNGYMSTLHNAHMVGKGLMPCTPML